MIKRFNILGGDDEWWDEEPSIDGDYVKYTDFEPYERCRDYLSILLSRFQWTDRGFGQLTCRSCGAAAAENLDVEGSDRVKRLEECARTCPWRLAGETLTAIHNHEH